VQYRSISEGTWRCFFCEIFRREESYTRRKIRRKPRGTKEDATEYLRKKVDASTPKRKCTKLSSSKTGRQKTRMIGMMRFDIKKKKFTRVSLVKGGGTRKVDLPCDFNREDVIRYAVKLFFPRRRICTLYF